MLNMMSQLVRENVRFREVAGRAEAALQLIIEAEIDIHPLVERTVERSHRRLGRSTPGLRHVAEENELRVLVGHMPIAENRTPSVLHVIEHVRDELHEAIFGRRAGNLS